MRLAGNEALEGNRSRRQHRVKISWPIACNASRNRIEDALVQKRFASISPHSAPTAASNTPSFPLYYE